MNESLEQLAQIAPSDRILLLPHCLRTSDGCKAKYDQYGLQCAGCNPDCAINKLRTKAFDCGYKGVCVAPGGRMAMNFVKKYQPTAIVAVACEKELTEGIEEINKLYKDDVRPLLVTIPLCKDGCIDTEINDEAALNVISTGFALPGKIPLLPSLPLLNIDAAKT